MSRPTVITAKVVRKLEEELRLGKTVKMACFISGISRETYYSHFKSDPTFSDKMESAQAWVESAARENVARAISKGDISVSKWYLERKSRNEFGTKSESDVKIAPIEHQPHMVPVLSSDEALATLDNLIDLRKRMAEPMSDAVANAGNPDKILNMM